ncbi:MAG: ribonuclease R [bacterium]
MPKKNRSRNRSPKGKPNSPGGSPKSGRGFFAKAGKNKPSSDGYEVIGVVQANEKGFGFLVPEDGSPDAFMPPHQMRDIMNGDTIKARVINDPRKAGKFIAETLSIEKRAHQTLVGTLVKEQGRGFLKPDDARLTEWVALKSWPSHGKEGQKAVAKITQWPGQSGALQGEVAEILGFPNEPGVDMTSVIHKYQWPTSFSKGALSETHSLPPNPKESDWVGRLDLRQTPLLTIDGADAKDFDDAISLERTPSGGYRLGVHIADVSHYVREGNNLDTDAQGRATSVYLADRVLPMLPHELSDGLCSLREGVPRLTLSAFLEYSASGQRLKTEFFTSVIQSFRRGTYQEVQQVLDRTATPEVSAKYSALEPMLREMLDLSRIIRRRRQQEGSLDFDFPEIRVVLDASGNPVDVRKTERLETHRLIEDFMVAANEAVAEHLSQNNIPAMYRIHEPPDLKDLEEIIALLQAYRIPFEKKDLTTPIGLSHLMISVKGHPLEPVIAILSLRSLKLAVYSSKNAGHFGLGLKSYCHFTSPIRRYPDLVVHRALKKMIEKKTSNGPLHHYEKLAHLCSLQERQAEKAERESQRIKQLKFMEDKVGNTFTGLVRHMTAHGVYVDLEPYGLEGFVPLENLTDDQYQFDEKAMVLRGKRGSFVRYGERMKTRVLSVDAALQRLTLAKEYA